jgi:hypothetical protein
VRVLRARVLTLRQLWTVVTGYHDLTRCLTCQRGQASLVYRGQVFIYCPRCFPQRGREFIRMIDGEDAVPYDDRPVPCIPLIDVNRW